MENQAISEAPYAITPSPGTKRLRCSYNPVGTKQGRLSSSETIFGTGTNMQNQPTAMKRLMQADKGYLLANIDLSQAENRIVAYIAGEDKMIAAFEEGRDIHRLTASLIFDKPPEEISDEKGSASLGSGDQSERDWGKRGNHSLNYGIGPFQFATYYEISKSDAELIMGKYHSGYPAVQQWQLSIVNQLNKNRTLQNLFGRKRRFLDRWGQELFKEAYSFIPQSTVADKINRQGVLVVYSNEPPFTKVELLTQVHDSIAIQHPITCDQDIETFSAAILKLKEELETPLDVNGNKLVIPADLGVGFNCGKRGPKNQLGLKEFKSHEYASVDRLAEQLDEIHREYRAS